MPRPGGAGGAPPDARPAVQRDAQAQPEDARAQVRRAVEVLMPERHATRAGHAPCGRPRRGGPRPVAGSQRWGGRGFNEVESALAQRWDDASREAGVQPAQLATAWLLAQPGVTGAIIGAERFESLQQSCEAAELELSSDLVETLGAVMAETPAGGR